MDVENKKGCMVTGMMSFSESELNELRKLRDNGEPLEPEELRAVNRKELFDRNRKPEPTASEPMPEPVAEPTPDTTIGATYRKVYETWLEQSKTGHPTERSIAEALGKPSPPSTITSRTWCVTDTSSKTRSANENTC